MGKLLRRIENGFLFLAIVSVLMMVFLTTVDIVGRYLLNNPIPKAYEITEKYLMVLAVFFGLCYAYREGVHVRITLLESRLPPKGKLVVNYFVQIISILFSMFLFVASVIPALRRINDIWDITSYELPVGPAHMAAVVGLFFMTLWILIDLWQIKKGKSGFFKEESIKDSLKL
jgi:TRAP-type C4-dicarboxylate transport system permease small subunit